LSNNSIFTAPYAWEDQFKKEGLELKLDTEIRYPDTFPSMLMDKLQQWFHDKGYMVLRDKRGIYGGTLGVVGGLGKKRQAWIITMGEMVRWANSSDTRVFYKVYAPKEVGWDERENWEREFGVFLDSISSECSARPRAIYLTGCPTCGGDLEPDYIFCQTCTAKYVNHRACDAFQRLTGPLLRDARDAEAEDRLEDAADEYFKLAEKVRKSFEVERYVNWDGEAGLVEVVVRLGSKAFELYLAERGFNPTRFEKMNKVRDMLHSYSGLKDELSQVSKRYAEIVENSVSEYLTKQKEKPDPTLIAHCFMMAARAYSASGHKEGKIRCYRKALEFYRKEVPRLFF